MRRRSRRRVSERRSPSTSPEILEILESNQPCTAPEPSPLFIVPDDATGATLPWPTRPIVSSSSSSSSVINTTASSIYTPREGAINRFQVSHDLMNPIPRRASARLSRSRNGDLLHSQSWYLPTPIGPPSAQSRREATFGNPPTLGSDSSAFCNLRARSILSPATFTPPPRRSSVITPPPPPRHSSSGLNRNISTSSPSSLLLLNYTSPVDSLPRFGESQARMTSILPPRFPISPALQDFPVNPNRISDLVHTFSNSLSTGENRFLQSTVAIMEGPGNYSDTAPESIKNLAHSFKCQQRENQENDVLLLCTLPFCPENKNLINHISTCQSTGCNVCSASTREIVNHWKDCRVVDDCPLCLPIRQAEINLNQSVSAPPISNGPSMNPAPSFLRRPHHRSSANAPFPSTHTATSGLLTNQVPANQAPRNDRISSRSSMWHPNYPENPPPWRSAPGPSTDDSLNAVNRRSSPRYNWYPNNRSNFRMERRAPYPTNPWTQPEVLFIEHGRSSGGPSTSGMQPQHQHSSRSMFGNSVGSGRSNERAQAPYMSPWRNASPDLYTLVHGRPPQPEPIADVEPAITEAQLFQAMMKVIKTNGCRLEQKYRCPTRPCPPESPCIHRRLASSIRSHKTPIPA